MYKTELFVLDILPVLILLTVGTPLNVPTCFLSFDIQFQWTYINNLTVEFYPCKIFLSLVLKPLLPKETLHGGFTVLFRLSCASRWQPTWSFWILVIPGYSISIQVRRLLSVMFLIHYVFFLCTGCAELTHVIQGSLSSVCMFLFQIFSIIWQIWFKSDTRGLH